MATTAEWSKALDSGSREAGSIPVSAPLVFFSALPTRKMKLTVNEHGRECGCPSTRIKAAPLGGDVPAGIPPNKIGGNRLVEFTELSAPPLARRPLREGRTKSFVRLCETLSIWAIPKNFFRFGRRVKGSSDCLLYTSDAADE